MKLFKNGVIVATMLIFTLGIISVAHAANDNANNKKTVSDDVNVKTGVLNVSTTIRGNATSSMHGNTASSGSSGSLNNDEDSNDEDTNDEDNDATGSDATSTTHGNGNGMGEMHRSVVANFVHSLLSVADREGGIGAEVRVIAQAQNDSASTTATAMTKIEGRNNLITFLFGSDYKNLGAIRNELAETSLRIDELKALAEKTTDPTDKAELEAQIKVMEEEQLKIQNFIDEHENSTSLFGWFIKLFNK